MCEVIFFLLNEGFVMHFPFELMNKKGGNSTSTHVTLSQNAVVIFYQPFVIF